MKTGFIPFVARRSPDLFHPIHYRIVIAVGKNLLDDLHIAGGSPLVPQFPAGSAPVVGLSGFKGFLPGRLVDVGQHQHFSCIGILGNGGEQAVTLFKIKRYGFFFRH